MQKLSQVLQQTQKLSPQQIQVIRMLELPVMELEKRVQQELEDNPTLDEGPATDAADNPADHGDDPAAGSETYDEISLGDYRSEDDIPDYKLHESNRSRDERQPEFTYSASSSFTENLEKQIALKELTPELRACAEYIIGNLDDNGYLVRPIQAISDDLAFSIGMDIPVWLLDEALSVVQELDPAGVGARDLRECLLLQLERRKATPASSLAYRVIDEEFDAFSKKHFDKICRSLDITSDELRDAQREILTLNPKPGNSFSDTYEEKQQQIIPDFIIENVNGEIMVSLNNGNIPQLHISNQYADMFEDWNNRTNRNSDTRNAVMFVKQKLDSARWFIDALEQRNATMLQTIRAIISLQKDFFLTGDETRMRPMILKDVADLTGYDISTISRVSNSKYALTDFGVFQLKYFFSEGSQTDQGEEVTTRAIKKILADCISAEDKRKPLPDDKLSELLADKGYTVARRTVAKYREQLGIPVARLRKEI